MNNYLTTLDSTTSGVLEQSIPPVKCWVFDPPYNIGYKYGSKVNDSLSWNDYSSMIQKSVNNMYLNTEEGHLFMINYPIQTSRLLHVIESTGWNLKQWITWVYPSNVGHSKKKFTTASRVITWFVKGNPDYNIRATLQPFKNPNDKRIKERIANGQRGVAHYDWWHINMRKNVSKGYAGWANQLPLELVERIILTTTNDNDLVGDMMAGGGTTLEACIKLNRYCWMNDIDERALDIWREIK